MRTNRSNVTSHYEPGRSKRIAIYDGAAADRIHRPGLTKYPRPTAAAALFRPVRSEFACLNDSAE